MSPQTETNETPGNQEVASAKEKHDLLYGMLKDGYSGVIDFEFKHAGFMAVVIGWLATSKQTQLVLSDPNSTIPKVVGTILILSLTLFHSVWCKRWYDRSHLAFTRLIHLGYMPEEYYRPHRMGRFLPSSFAVMHFLLAIAIVLFIWLMKAIVPDVTQGA